MTIHQHGLNRSLIMHIRDKLTDARVDLMFDGYVMPKERPLIIVEPMMSNFTILSKQREAIGAIYRYQVGLFDVNSVNLSINQERLQRIFNFDEMTYYDTLASPQEEAGSFRCELTGIVPMPADDVTLKSHYFRVYYDIEIQNIKRRR